MTDRSNIIFILSDQQRYDTVGCYGQTLDVTPHLDALASEGVRFQHAFTPQPVCGPARACLYDLKRDPYEKMHLIQSDAHIEVKKSTTRKADQRYD